MAKGDKISQKQALFCQHYVTDLNATQAAINAGYSQRTARQIASELLSKPHVAARVQELLKPKMDRYEITTENTLKHLAAIAYGRMGDIASWNESGVRFKPSEEIEEMAMASIEEVSESVSEHGCSLKIKQHSKAQALKLLGQYQALFKDRVEHSLESSFASLVLASVAAEKK